MRSVEIRCLDVAQDSVREQLDHEICMKLSDGCVMSENTVGLNKSLYNLKQSGRQRAGPLV